MKTTSNKDLAETLDGCVDSRDPVVNKVSKSSTLGNVKLQNIKHVKQDCLVATILHLEANNVLIYTYTETTKS